MTTPDPKYAMCHCGHERAGHGTTWFERNKKGVREHTRCRSKCGCAAFWDAEIADPLCRCGHPLTFHAPIKALLDRGGCRHLQGVTPASYDASIKLAHQVLGKPLPIACTCPVLRVTAPSASELAPITPGAKPTTAIIASTPLALQRDAR